MAVQKEFFERILARVRRKIHLSAAFINQLQKYLYEENFKKGTIILHPRELPSKCWWLLSGCAREYIINYNESVPDQTKWFWNTDDFIYTTPGFFSQSASESYIELLEDSHVLYIEFNNYLLMMSEFEEARQYWELIRDELIINTFRHLHGLCGLNARERYLVLFEKNPKLFYLAKQKDIAYFLGIEADTLGRLRKKFG
jgi:CRP-like cAMP-binding protein